MYGVLTGMVVGGALPLHWRAAMEEDGADMHETQRLLRKELQIFGKQRIRGGTDVSEEFVRAVEALRDSETDVDMSAVAELVASAHQLTIAILRVMGGNVFVQIFTPADPGGKGRRLVCLWQQQELQQGQRGHFAGVRVREDMNVVQLQRTPGRVCQDVLEINCRAVPRHLSMMGKVGGGEPTGGLRGSPAPVVPRPTVLPLASSSAVSTAGLSTAGDVGQHLWDGMLRCDVDGQQQEWWVLHQGGPAEPGSAEPCCEGLRTGERVAGRAADVLAGSKHSAINAREQLLRG
eukprot:jgi/Botrbrau1/19215/Bobra.0077s0116.1